jgi:hypothetical protein
MKKIYISAIVAGSFIFVLILIGYFYRVNNKSAQAIENNSTEQVSLEKDSEECGCEETADTKKEDVCEKDGSRPLTSKIVNSLKDDSINKHLK